MATQTRVIGPISAYAIAVQEGYTGTKQEFATEIGNAQVNAQAAQAAATRAENAAATLPDDFNDIVKNFAPVYTDLTLPVPAGTYCTHNGVLYRANTTIASGETWTQGHWTRVDVGGEMGELKGTVNNLVEQELADTEFNDWASETAVEAYPYGWRTGFWKDNGSAGASDNYLMTASKIRNFEVEGYSSLFDGVYFVKVALPNGYTLRVKEFNSSGTMTQNLTLNDGDIFYVSNEQCTYGLHIGNFNGNAAEYITTEFLSQIVLTLYTEKTPDKTLTKSGESADAKAVGDAINALNEKIINIGVPETEASSEWGSGGLNDAMTAVVTDSKLARTKGSYLKELPSEGTVYVKIPSSLLARIAVYSRQNFYYKDDIVSSTYVTGEVFIPEEYNGKYLGMDCKKANGTDFTEEEIAALSSQIVVKTTNAIGDVHDLETEFKRTLVGAVNETYNKIDNAYDRLPESVYDWDNFSTVTYPTGWRMGSWTDAGVHNTGGGNAIHLIRMLTKTDFQGVKQIKIEWTGGYTCSFKVFLRSAPTTLYSRTDYPTSGIIIDIDDTLDAFYGINIAGFGTDAQTALDNDYPDNIVITKIMKASAEIEKKFRDRDAEFFYVPINSAYPTGAAEETATPVNVDCVLKLPQTYSPTGTPTRLIFMHHGNTGTVNTANQTWYTEVNAWKNFVDAYLNAGYAVFDVNGAGPVTDTNASHDYASITALAAAYKAYEYIRQRYNVTDRIFVHGSSMGGATAYAFVKHFGGIVDAVGLFSPALLSRSAQMDSVDDYIAANYGYADTASMIADGYARLIPSTPKIEYYLNGAKTDKPYTYDWVNDHTTDGLNIVCSDIHVPIKIWCGTADTAVPPQYGYELAKAIVNGGGFALFRSVQGGTHNAGLGDDSMVNAEAVMWFDRFK